MGWFTGTVLFVLIWWLSLFAVLPFWTRPVAGAERTSGWRGTPDSPHLLRKALVTTLVAAVVWSGCYLVVTYSGLSFRHGILAMHQQ